MSRTSRPAGERPDRIQADPPAPADFVPLSPTEAVLDILYWCHVDCPKQAADASWPLGSMLGRFDLRSLKRPRDAGSVPPSIRRALEDFTNTPAYTTGMPFVRLGVAPRVDPVAPLGYQTIEGIATVNVHPPACIPVSTVVHERQMLRWDDPQCLCSSGADCVAARLDGAPGPLPYYVPAGCRRSDYEQPAFCLLCIRADAAAVSAVYESVVSSSQMELGRAAVVLPPFQNLVNCEDGYYEAALGVRPSTRIFTPVAIVGPDVPLLVATAANGVKYVDQSAAEWRPGGHFLAESVWV